MDNPDEMELPQELASAIAKELHPGERIVWQAQPLPDSFARSSSAAFWLGGLFTTFALFWTIAGVATSPPNDRGCMLSSGLLFLSLGVWMLTSPFRRMSRARRVVYLVTDQRALIIETGRHLTVRSFLPEQLKGFKRRSRRDGSGDIFLSQDWSVDSNDHWHATDVGFVAIADAKEAERHLYALRKSKSSKKQGTPNEVL